MSIINKIKDTIRQTPPEFQYLLDGINDLKMLQGRELAWKVAAMKPSSITEVEFKVYSQLGDDGIIQYLVSKLPIKNKKFVEFGVENYLEANTRFLLMNNNWSGLIMDGSEDHVAFIKRDNQYWKHDLTAHASFITAENINDLLEMHGFTGNIGLLHIDIDGNDYWVWKAITVADADIVIMEYNSVFGKSKAWTVPYRPDFVRTSQHHSNLYFGASVKALVHLGKEKGYAFIGSNSGGNNLYFVKREMLNFISLNELTAEQGYVKSKFRESRNEAGELTFISGDDRLKVIKGMPVVNVETGETETI